MSGSPKLGETVEVGQVLLGKYRVEAILGHGGMGVIAQCMHIALNERVAIKMMRQDVTEDPAAVERFMREAQAAVKLKSEYVARVSDVGRFDDGTPYMVMEYLEGHDLGELLEQRGSVSIPWAAAMMLQAAEALAEAHSLNIVHRDIKPTNLFVTWRSDGTPMIKVLDFGISKVHAIADLRLTNTQSLLGTPAYMSPEQMRSARNVDARTDTWALGIVMYELVEGRRPFEAESFTELCVKVSIDPPAPMVIAPPELQRVILRCLAKSPAERYGSMSELGRDLLPFVTNPREAVLVVERMERMIWRRATEHDNDTTTRVASPPVVEVAPADTEPVSSAKRWPELTPTTEPDVHPAQVGAPRAPIVPVLPPPPDDEGPANDDDTIFEVGSTHVPFTDRRGDDLAPAPRPPPRMSTQLPQPRPSKPLPVPVQPPLLMTPVLPRGSRGRWIVLAVAVALLAGAGLLVAAMRG